MGLGPYDEGYPGPDADGSEGDGKPEQGEPNFGVLDKDESDQLGLTGFEIFATHKYDLNNDEHNWVIPFFKSTYCSASNRKILLIFFPLGSFHWLDEIHIPLKPVRFRKPVQPKDFLWHLFLD